MSLCPRARPGAGRKCADDAVEMHVERERQRKGRNRRGANREVKSFHAFARRVRRRNRQSVLGRKLFEICGLLRENDDDNDERAEKCERPLSGDDNGSLRNIVFAKPHRFPLTTRTV